MKKALKIILTALLVEFLSILAIYGISYAFHEGGVGYCEGCHIQHESQNGDIKDVDEGVRTGQIKGSDPSSNCLRCHGTDQREFSDVLSKDGSVYSSGGDFYWLKKSFTWNTNGRYYQSTGDSHGHNVIAADYGLNQDIKLNSAPGGTYPAAAMSCTSCHDPHGKTGNADTIAVISVSGSYGELPPEGTIAGNYILLGGAGYSGGTQLSGITFTQPAPIAKANPRKWTETDSNHTAYGSGMSEWCSNCHTDYLNGNNKHSAGNSAKLNNDIASNYNSYVKTGDLTGTKADAYLTLVPFELGTTDKSPLNPSSTSGPEAGKANVMCLTCHRAHASAFQNIGRWDFSATFIANSHPQPTDGGVSGNDALNSYYGRNMAAEFGQYQRQLCNKCHIQD